LKILISWSGERSSEIAQILREWLPTILPGIDPWMSSEDIKKGRHWSQELATQLAETQFGLLVVLPENQGSAWLNFEAGAISKWLEFANVAPVLFSMPASQLHGPLAQFQATIFSKEDILKLLKSVSAVGGKTIIASNIERSLDFSWQALHDRIETVLKKPARPVNLNHADSATNAVENMPLSDEHVAILTRIGTSEGNFMTEKDITEALQMTRARVQLLLGELTQVGYLSAEHVSMLGTCYSVASKGTRYLIDQGLI
jgi:TIR domain-containing protein